jgi:two-component system NtrC family sensor kinase
VTSQTDGLERRLGYRRLAEYPIYVGAGLETSAIHAPLAVHHGPAFDLRARPPPRCCLPCWGWPCAGRGIFHFEAEKRQVAEEALKHGQRLKRCGQLTGGVAHDFNNLLTVIRASVDLLRRPDLPEPRAAALYRGDLGYGDPRRQADRQLLAFARRQTLKPEVFEVGRSVQTLAEMIRHPDRFAHRESSSSARTETVLRQRRRRPVRNRHHQHGRERAGCHRGPRTADDCGGHGRQSAQRRAAVAKSLWLCCGIRRRHRQRHSAGSVRTHLRTFLHDQAGRPWHRARPVAGVRLRQAIRRRSGRRQRGWQGQRFHAVSAAHRRQRKSRQMPAADASAIAGSGMSVLVVEDNAEVGQFATDALADLGYTTRLVGSGAHALEVLAVGADCFDVVFTDVVMPGMTGLELTQEIRRRYADLPVVLTSGYSHVLSEHGSHGFELLQKPYSVEQLSRVLHRVGRRKFKQTPTAASS